MQGCNNECNNIHVYPTHEGVNSHIASEKVDLLMSLCVNSHIASVKVDLLMSLLSMVRTQTLNFTSESALHKSGGLLLI